MHLVYIHGAKATPNSFNYLRSKIYGFPETLISYHSSSGFVNNLEKMTTIIEPLGDVFFIAHSLGGLYALHLKEILGKQVKGAVTLSTPYNGSNMAHVLKYLSVLNPQQLFYDITPYAYPVVASHKIKIDIPWTNIVTTEGHNSLMGELNDGIVSRRSMIYRKDMELIDLDTNHYEVLLYPKTVEIIKSKINNI
jgi:pimeloyl-ACP methyl ester carboxylesterase